MARHLSLLIPALKTQADLLQQNSIAPLDEFKAMGFRFCHWVVDVSSGAVSHISREFETVFQIKADSMANDPKSFIECILPDDLAQIRSLFGDGMESTLDLEFRVLDGKETRWIWLRSFPIENEDFFSGERILFVAEDITSRKKAKTA